VLSSYATLTADLQPKAIELLTQRAFWAKPLLAAVGEKRIPSTAINLNQARRLKELKDDELSTLLATHWGQVREGRDPNREQYIATMKSLIRKTPGDAAAGEKAFKKVCAQCHKIYGEGAEVGPDITRNGRNDFTQLLSNVFDPSLVIGAGYRSFTVVTNGGRVLNGLLVEDSPQRVVLKVQGGKQEIIARSDIDEFKVSEISLMPEQLEKQLSQQEIIDLFAFITLDKHPSDPSARRLPGVSQVAPRESQNPAEFPSLVAEILPGFTTTESGENGVGLLAEYRGHDNVLRTHPVSRDKPCVLSMKLTPPADKKTRLVVDVSHDARGDWRLVVRGNGQRMADEMISKETTSNGWKSVTIDLSKFAGQELKLDLVNQANDWAWEYGYWGGARIVSE
jgi:putative heme-binding domain-containing protein